MLQTGRSGVRKESAMAQRPLLRRRRFAAGVAVCAALAGAVISPVVLASEPGAREAAADHRLDINLRYGHQTLRIDGVSLGSISAGRYGPATSRALRAKLGPWSSCRPTLSLYSTELIWPRLGLTVRFATLGGQPPRCGTAIDGFVTAVIVDDRGSTKWTARTDRGTLRIGMRSSAIPSRLRNSARISTDPEPSTALFWPREDVCGPRAAEPVDLLRSALSSWEFRGRVYQIASYPSISEGTNCD